MTIHQLVRRDLKAAVRAMFAGFVEAHAIRGTGVKKQRRRKCLSCGGPTHPAAMHPDRICGACKSL